MIMIIIISEDPDVDPTIPSLTATAYSKPLKGSLRPNLPTHLPCL